MPIHIYIELRNKLDILWLLVAVNVMTRRIGIKVATATLVHQRARRSRLPLIDTFSANAPGTFRDFGPTRPGRDGIVGVLMPAAR